MLSTRDPSSNRAAPAMSTELAHIIDAAFEDRANVNASTRGAVRDGVDDGAAPPRLRQGAGRREDRRRMARQSMAEEGRAAVVPPQRHGDRSRAVPAAASWWDKVPSKFDGWNEDEFRAAGFRAVPNCVVRRSRLSSRPAWC